MKTISREIFEAAEEDAGVEITYHERYVGPGMHGRTTALAFSGGLTDLLRFVDYLGRFTTADETENLVKRLRITEYGYHHIAYAPGWAFTEDA